MTFEELHQLLNSWDEQGIDWWVSDWKTEYPEGNIFVEEVEILVEPVINLGTILADQK